MQSLRVLVATLLLIATAPMALAEPFAGAGQFAEHLRFLGYSVEETDDRLIGRHNVHYTLTVSKLRGGVMLRSYITGAEWAKVDRRGFLELINRLNEGATSMRYYADADSDLASEAWFPGPYDRERFGVLVDEFNADLEKLQELNSEEKKFFE